MGAAVDALTAAGCQTPRLDAELLIAGALGVPRASVIADPAMAVPGSAARVIGERIRRRVMREPVAYILGRQAFRHIELAVDPRVLIPRPETELLVECAVKMDEGACVHDLGTGSGAVALAIASERPDMRVTASDASAAAIDVAVANGSRLGLRVEFAVASDWPGRVAESHSRHLDGNSCRPGGESGFSPDLVVANLPYVREDEWAMLQPEIRLYEPRSALVSGVDGLDAVRQLIRTAPAGTQLALEHAPAQAAEVRSLLVGGETLRDLAGRERVTLGSVP
ncbi:MAG TPA: peptide chain release factor N(5)-glutamine methyltransferase [Thermoleophilaceae bacterium]|jgi:release factor glutamine methyltransferase|nr:peptide chain release factor N(5)-glutamine methyltransferase [Thermoleophilaceae bacterium]